MLDNIEERHPMEREYSRNSDISPNTVKNDTFDVSKRDEISKKVRDKQEEITMKILESSKRSVRLLRNAEDIAVSTSRELHGQSEQLIQTEKSLEELNSSLKKNDQLINKIKSPFGFLKNFTKRKQESLLGWRNKKHAESKNRDASKSCSHSTILEGNYPLSGNLGATVRNNREKLQEKEKCSSAKGLEKLLDDDLDEISCSVARLKNIALEMGNEVDIQNEHLDHIINKSEKVSIVLQKQNKTVKGMIG